LTTKSCTIAKIDGVLLAVNPSFVKSLNPGIQVDGKAIQDSSNRLIFGLSGVCYQGTSSDIRLSTVIQNYKSPPTTNIQVVSNLNSKNLTNYKPTEP
jgi:hypothetical protein